MTQTTDTIVALSTAPGLGGIAIVRLSGPSAIQIADGLFVAANKKALEKQPHARMNFGLISLDTIKEKGYAVVFFAPNSFTGETVVEFHVHGGYMIGQTLVEKCKQIGARVADKGEFSKRAFLNGKASLDSLEGMIEMIHAESEAELKAANSVYAGELKKKVEEVETLLTDTLAQIEVGIDYPDELSQEDMVELANKESKKAIDVLDRLLLTKKQGRKIAEGVKTLILGRPNVGKSSVLNMLLGEDLAIVTDIPGTTRDIMRERFVWKGMKFVVMDTAGIRTSSDKVESIGIERALAQVDFADIILVVLDGSSEFLEQDQQLLEKVKGKNVVLVLNKIDQTVKKSTKKAFDEFLGRKVEVSAKEGRGKEQLLDAIASLAKAGEQQDLVLTNQRHIEAIEQAKQELEKLNGVLTLDLVAFHLHQALESLGKISGKTVSEEVVTRIFSKFCVGK